MEEDVGRVTEEEGARLWLDSSSPTSPASSRPGTEGLLLVGQLGPFRDQSGVRGFGLRLSLREAEKGEGTGVRYDVELPKVEESGVFLRLLGFEVSFCGVRASDCLDCCFLFFKPACCDAWLVLGKEASCLEKEPGLFEGVEVCFTGEEGLCLTDD